MLIGKYGIRKSPDRIDPTDYQNTLELRSELQLCSEQLNNKEFLLSNTKKILESLKLPITGKNLDVKGMVLMEYTLSLTNITYRIFAIAEKKYYFKYSIEPLDSGFQYVQFKFGKKSKTTTVSHRDYVEALTWVLKTLRKSITRYKLCN